MEKVDVNITTFNSKSGEYKNFRPLYPERLFEVLRSYCKEGKRAWDSACGNGQVASSLVRYFDSVSASDLNLNQIENRIDHKNIDFSVQNSEETTYKNSSFDLVVVAQAMHWFNLDKFFSEVKRVLKPGGVFACIGYSFFTVSSEIDEIVKELVLDPISSYWSDKNRILWNRYEDVNFPFYKVDIEDVEMASFWTREELINYISTWSAYKRYRENSSKEILEELDLKLKKIWPCSEKKKVVMDFSAYVGLR